jgi:hypothetical protein
LGSGEEDMFLWVGWFGFGDPFWHWGSSFRFLVAWYSRSGELRIVDGVVLGFGVIVVEDLAYCMSGPLHGVVSGVMFCVSGELSQGVDGFFPVGF